MDEEFKRNKLISNIITKTNINAPNSPVIPNLSTATNTNGHKKNSTYIPKPKNQPTIVITVTDDKISLLKSPKLNKMLADQLKAKIKERSVVKNRLYLVHMSAEDTEEILRPDSYFYMMPRVKSLMISSTRS